MKVFCTLLLPLIFFFSCGLSNCFAQQTQPLTEEKLEAIAIDETTNAEHDDYLAVLEQYRNNPINLNKATGDELRQLMILNDLQIENLTRYRELFGVFINIYELQAVPGWDIPTIRKLINFIDVKNRVGLMKEIVSRSNGEQSLLMRSSQVIEKAKGFQKTATGNHYNGTAQSVLIRYRYIYKNNLQFGITADKDAGEYFFKGTQKYGFDFYSTHFFISEVGVIKAFTLGDFTVNMGQGLIQWQGLSFRKSSEVMSIKRQSPVLRSYHGAGEFYFFRGAGFTFQKRKVEMTVFASTRKIGANIFEDTIQHHSYISSFLTSGTHRNTTENADRNNIRQQVIGMNLKYRRRCSQIGLNGIYYHYSKEILKRNEPYNLFAIRGDQWLNASIDYSYTFKNLHFFGEAAIDMKNSKAFLNGLLTSVDNNVDISLLYRSIDKTYQTINGNAFTENTFPTNEKGIYAGISIRPVSTLRINAYADFFNFPWLKYMVNAPSHGTELMCQLTYTPSKQVEIYSRFRNEIKQTNEPGSRLATHPLINVSTKDWRTHIGYKFNKNFSLRNRVELVWFNNRIQPVQQGFLIYFDILYKPMMKPFSFIGRIQFFETDGYESRIYAYENDILYNYTVPSFSNKGMRYYLNFGYDYSKKLSFWLRWSQTIYNNVDHIGTGLDEIRGSKESQIKVQGRFMF